MWDQNFLFPLPSYHTSPRDSSTALNKFRRKYAIFKIALRLTPSRPALDATADSSIPLRLLRKGDSPCLSVHPHHWNGITRMACSLIADSDWQSPARALTGTD